MAQQKQRQFLDKKSKKLEEKKKNSPARQFPPYKVISKEEYFIRTSATHNHQTTNQNKTSKQLLAIDMKLRKPQKKRRRTDPGGV